MSSLNGYKGLDRLAEEFHGFSFFCCGPSFTGGGGRNGVQGLRGRGQRAPPAAVPRQGVGAAAAARTDAARRPNDEGRHCLLLPAAAFPVRARTRPGAPRLFSKLEIIWFFPPFLPISLNLCFPSWG